MKEVDIITLKPTLNEAVEIRMVTDDEYVVHQTKLKYQIRINQITKSVLSQLDGKKTIVEITQNLIKETQVKDVNHQMIYDLLYTDLYSYGIIDTNEKAKIRKNANYLKLRFSLIPKAIVHSFSTIFFNLFTGLKSFSILFSLLLSATIFGTIFFFYIEKGNAKTALTEIDSFILFLFSILICLIHEIGHTSALRYFNKKAGEIGLGFYFLYPIFYCDVSEAWFLNKKQRQVVNFGGIYFESIIGCIFLIMHFWTNNYIFIWMNLILLIRLVMNLNPFLRRDGYWVISDIANLPNLQRDSLQHIKKHLSVFVRQQKKVFKTNYFLLIYGFLSIAFIVTFVGFAIFSDPESILYFPINIWSHVQEISTQSLSFKSFSDLIAKFTLPLLFYFLAFKISFKWLKNKFETMKLFHLNHS